MDTSGGTLEGAVATYSCNVGYTINGVDSRTCTAQGWSDKEPTCESKQVTFCTPMPVSKGYTDLTKLLLDLNIPFQNIQIDIKSILILSGISQAHCNILCQP